jgi:hypothetical protein
LQDTIFYDMIELHLLSLWGYATGVKEVYYG